jgi:hypothetical protein
MKATLKSIGITALSIAMQALLQCLDCHFLTISLHGLIDLLPGEFGLASEFHASRLRRQCLS